MFDVGALKDKIVDKAIEVNNKVDDKDKKGIKEHIDGVVDGVQKKAADALKTADKIANSPEVGAIGTLSGPQAKEIINKGKEIIQDANQSPAIVGKSRANANAKNNNSFFGQQPGELSFLQQKDEVQEQS